MEGEIMAERQKPRRKKSARKKEKPKREPYEIVMVFPDVPVDPSSPAPSADSTGQDGIPPSAQTLTFRFGDDS
jgi:hypothetical protein